MMIKYFYTISTISLSQNNLKKSNTCNVKPFKDEIFYKLCNSFFFKFLTHGCHYFKIIYKIVLKITFHTKIKLLDYLKIILELNQKAQKPLFLE